MALQKSSKTVQIIILIILIITAILIGVFLLSKDKQPSSPKPTELPPQTSAAIEEPPTVTDAPIVIPDLNKQRAAELVKAYTSSIVFGLYIDFENSGITEFRNPPSDRYENYYRAGFFNTVEDGIEFTKQYLAENIFMKTLENSRDAYFTVEGELYVGISSRGYPVYDTDSITIQQNGDTATVYIDVYDLGEYDETDVFTAKYTDGSWKMTSGPVIYSK